MSGTTTISPYQRGRAEGDQALRSGLLDVAGDLLATGGSAALTMRGLAEESGCSTAVLYRLFDGKHRIVQALYREGFERLCRRLETVEPDRDALEHLAALASAYRRYALDEPTYYAVMFTRAVPEFEPSEEDLEYARRSLQILLDAVSDAQRTGRLGGPDAQHVAHVLWAAAHGAVSLELAGHLHDDADAVFTDLIVAAASRFVPPTH